jgi:centromere protein Sim4
MNASLETVPYVQLKKDGAAARFLVRAKVAAFHPGDARRLKLLDFGSTVEDE